MIYKISKKQTAILEAAVDIFSDKGFKNSTIAQIAKKAKVGETTVYNNFKNKFEIIMHTPLPFLYGFINDCNDQLMGIKDPKEKIRKLIWLMLWWSMNHKKHIKIFLMDIIPLKEFYHSEAFTLMQKIPQLFYKFHDQGKDKGVFAKDISNRMVLVFIFGTLMQLLFEQLISKQPFSPLDDFDDISKIIFDAIGKEQCGGFAADISKIKNKKERILIAGEMLFSQENSSETTIAQIAKAANVADGTIYDYFKNKEELLFHIFNKRVSNFQKEFAEIDSPENPKTKLKLAMFHFIFWLQRNKAWARVYIKNMVTTPQYHLSDEFNFKKMHDKKIEKLFTLGQEKGVFCKKLPPKIFLGIYFGPIYFLALPWALLDQKQSLMAEFDGLYHLLSRAINPKTETNLK